MTRTAKVLLGLAIACLVLGGALNLGWIHPRGLDALYTIFPVGAVFLGLFLIVLLLEKESRTNPEDKHLSEPSSEGPAKHAPPRD